MFFSLKYSIILSTYVGKGGGVVARPKRCRRICQEPMYASFSPETEKPQEEILLAVDEYETIRWIDLEKMTHAQCASQMDISRTTVTELYESARYKIADSLIHGKRLVVSGGHYRVCDGMVSCCRKPCRKAKERNRQLLHRREGRTKMKIAVTYENGEIFQHFGRTEQFKVYEVEDGNVIKEEVIGTNGSGHGALAGFLQAAGVDTLICGGIGAGAQNALQEAGIQFYGGVTGKADEAVKALLKGNLEFDAEVHCDHHDHEQEGDASSCGSHGCGNHGCHE